MLYYPATWRPVANSLTNAGVNWFGDEWDFWGSSETGQPFSRPWGEDEPVANVSNL
jgi:hypothetical protein